MNIKILPQFSEKRINNSGKQEISFNGIQANTKGITIAASAAISAIAIGIINIHKALEKQKMIESVNINTLFFPVENYRKTIIEELENINNEDDSFPEDLKLKMIEAIKNNKFNLREVYNEYYSALDLCENLDEVKELYPHLKFPDSPKTDYERTSESRDTARIYCSNNSYKYLLYGGTAPLHIRMRHYYSSEELKNAEEIIKSKTGIENTDSIIKAADTVNTNKKLSETLNSLFSIYNKESAVYLNEQFLTGLLKTMSFYKPEQNKNILELYKQLIQLKANNFIQLTYKKDAINSLTSGTDSSFSRAVTKIKTQEDLNKFFEIIKNWGLSHFLIDYPYDCIHLYDLSKNPRALNEIAQVFPTDTAKKLINIIMQNPNAKTILDNYEGYIKSNQISGMALQCMFIDLELSDDETGQKILEDILPGRKPLASKKALSRRFEGNNYDKAIIDALKQIHVDLTTLSNVKVKIGDNDWCYAHNIGRYNKDKAWSTPNKDLLNVIDKSEKINNTLSKLNLKLSELSESEYKTLAEIPAKRIYWEDFKDYTRGDWFVVRLIKDREYNDKSLYKTENLVESYLYNLYKESLNSPGKKYSTNPLARTANYPFLTKYSKRILDESYKSIYRDRLSTEREHFIRLDYHPESYVDRADFIKFCEENNFDKDEIAKSLMKIERAYHAKFYKMYHSKEGRVDTFRIAIDDAMKLIYEKLSLFNKTQAQAKTTTTNEIKAIIDEIDGTDNYSEGIDDEKLSKMRYYVQSLKNPELKARCQSCINSDYIDNTYFEYIYNLIENSFEQKEDGKRSINEMKVLVILKLHDKYIEKCDIEMTEEEFITNELNNYKLDNENYDYNKYYTDMKSELDFYTLINVLECENQEEIVNYITNFKLNNADFGYNQANEFMLDYLKIPLKQRSIIIQIINKSDKCYTIPALENIKKTIATIDSWHMDRAEIIIINDAGVNKKVIITKKAKNELWDKYNGNYTDFDTELKKYYKAANKYAPEESMPGIKSFENGSAELKIKGKIGGGMRMYTRPITEEDIENYKTDKNDKMPIKYIFDRYGDHT